MGSIKTIWNSDTNVVTKACLFSIPPTHIQAIVLAIGVQDFVNNFLLTNSFDKIKKNFNFHLYLYLHLRVDLLSEITTTATT